VNSLTLKLNIGTSDGDSTPPEMNKTYPTYRSGSLENGIKTRLVLIKRASLVFWYLA